MYYPLLQCSKKSSCGHRKLTSEIDVGNPAQIIDDVTKLFEVVKITPTTKIDPNYNLVSTFKSCANEMACQETVTGESDERGKNAVCDNNTFIPLDKPLLWDESNSNTDSANGIDRHICRRRQGRPRPPRPTCIRTSYRRKHDCNQRSLLQPNSGHDMNDKDLIARTAICDSKMDYLGCEQENLTDSITQGSSCTSPRKNSEKHSSLVGESTLELLSTCDESLFDSRGLDQTQQLGKRRRGRPRSSSHTLHVENNSRCRRRQVCVNTSATTDCVSEVDSNNECQSFHQTETQRVENICNPKHNLHQSKPHYGQCQGRATGIVTRRQKVLMQTEICSGASETVEIGDKESDFDTSDQCVDRSPATKLKLRFGDKRQCPVTDCERVISRSLRSQLKIVPERSHRNSKMSLRNIGCRAGNVKRKDITSKTDDICKVKQSFTPDLCAPTGNLKGTKRNTCRETACHNYGHKVVSGSGRIPLNEKEPESTVENASEKGSFSCISSPRRLLLMASMPDSSFLPTVESRSILEIKAVSRGTSTPNFENLHDGTGITSNVLDANGSDVDDYALSSTVIEMELVSSRNNTQTMPGTEENVKVELNASNKICQGLSPTTVDKVNVSSCENKSSLRGNSRRTGRLRKVRMGSLYRDSTPSLSPQESTSSIKEGNEPTVEEDDVCSLNSESYVKSAVRHSSRLSRRAFCKTLTDVALQTSVSNVKKSRDISSLDTTASRADEGHLENCQANEILQRSEESSRSYQKNFKEDSCSAVDSNNCTYNDALCYQELSDATTKNAEFDRNHSDSFSKETPKGEVLKTGATSQDLRNFPPNSKLRRSSRKRSVRFLPDPFKAMRSRKPASYFIELTDVHSLGCQQNPDPASFNDATSPRNVPTDILNSENSEINGTSEISPLNTSTLKDCVGKNPSSGSTHEVPEVAAFDELNDTLKENETKNCDPCMKETSTVEKYQSDSMLKSTPGKRRRGRRKRFSKIKRRSYLCRRKQSYSLPQCGKTPSHVMDSESAVSDVSDNEYYEKKPKNKNKYSFMGDFGDSPPHIAESEVEPGCLTTIQTLNYINESCSTQNSENHPNDEGQKNKNECYFSANSVTENIDITERSNGPAEAKHDTEPRNANIIGGENSVQNETLSEEVNVSIESSEIPSSQVCEKVNTGSYRGRKKVSFVNNSEAVSVINEPSRKRLSRLHHHVGTRVSNDDQAVIEYNRKIQRRSIRFQRNYGNLLDSVCPEVISDSSIIKKPVDNSDNSVILSRRGRLSLQRHRQHRSSLSLEFASDALNNAKCDVIVSDEESDVSKVEHEGETSLQCFPDLVNDNKNDIVSTEEPLLPSCNVQKTLEANRCIVSKVDDGKTLEICVKDITVKLVPDDIMEESLQQLGCEVVLISRISEELESVKRHKYDDVDCLPTSTPVAQKTKWKKIVMVSSDEDSIDAVETIFCSEELDEGQDKEISLESPEIKEDSCFPFESGMRDIVKAKSKCKRVVFSDEDDEDTQDEEDEETQDEEDDSDSLAESDRPFTRSRGEAPIISPRTKYLRQRRRPSRFCGDDLSDFIVESSVSDTSNYSEFSCSDDEMSSNVNTSEDDQELSDSDESDSYFQRRRLTRRKNLRPKRKLSPKTVKKEENVGSDNVLDSVAVQNPEEVNSCELATVLPLGMRKSKRYGVDYNPHAYHLFFNPSTALIDSSPSVFNSQRRKKLENTGPKVLATDVPLTLNPYVKLNRLTSADIEKYQNVQQASVSIGELQGDVNEAWDHFTSFWKDKTTENLTMLELPKVTKESNSDADDAFSVENGGEPFDSYSADEDGGNSPMSHEHTAAVEHNSGVDVSKTVCNTNNLKTATFSDYLPDFSDEEEEDTLNEDDRYGGYEDALYKMSFWSPTPGDDASEAARTPPRCSSPSGSLNELTNENENQEITMLRDDNAVANCENNETMQKRLIGDGSNPTLDVVNGMSLGTIEDLFNRGLSGGLNSRSSRGRNVARRGRPFSKSTSCKRTRVPVNRYTSMISPSRGKSRRGRPRNRGRKIRLGSINPKPYQLMREALPNTPPPLQIVIKEHNRNSHRNVGLTVESIRTGEKKSKKKPLVKILSSNPYVEPSCGKLLTKMLNGLNPQINTHGDELGETAPLSAAHPGFPRDLTLEQRNEISALSLRKLRWTRKKMRPRKKKPPNPPKLDVTTVLARVPAVDGEPWRFPGLETGASWSFGLTYSNSHVKRFAVPASRMQLPLASGESHQFLGAYRGTAGNWMQTGQTGESWTANMNVNEDQPNIGDRDATTNTVNVSQSTLGEQSEIGRPPLLESNTDGKTASQSSSFALPNVNRLPFGLPNSGLVDNSGDPIDWKEVLEAGEEDMWMAFGSANTANEIHLKKGLVKRHHKDVPTLPSTRGVELCSGSTELKDNLLNSNQMLSSQSQKGGSDGPFANSQRSYFTQKSLQSTHATHLPFSQNVMSASENFSKKLPSDSQMLSSNFSNHSTKTRISSQSFESRTKSVVEPRCNVNQSVIPLGRPEEKLNEPFVVPLVVRPPVPDTPVCDLTLSPRSYGGDKSPEIFDCWDGIQPTGSFQDFPFTFQAPVFNDTFLKPADKSSDPAQASKTGSHVVKTRTSDIHPLPETTENGQATSTEKMTCETVKPVNDVSSQCIAEFSDDDDDNIGPSGDIIKTLERVVEGLNFKIGESRVTATEEECSSSETRILQLDGTSRKSRNSTEDVDQDAESTFIELVGSSLKEIPSSDNTFSGNSISRVDVHTLTPLTACNVTASDDVDNDVSEIVDHQDGTPIASTSSREVEPHSSCSKVPSTEECDDEADLNLTPIQSFYLYGDEEAPWSSTTVLQDESIESGSVISSINSERIGRSKANLSTKCMLGGVLLSNVTVLSYVFTPPSPTAIENSLANYSIPEIRYPLVHCSNITDVPKKPLQLGGGTVILKLGSKSLSELQDCESDLCVTGLSHWRQVIKVVEENGSLCASGCDFESKTTRKPMRYRGVCFEFWPPPPSSLSVRKWLHDHCKGTGIDSVSPLVIRNARLKTISGHIFARQDNKNELLFPTAMENDYDRSILPLVPMKSASFSMHSTPNFSYLVKANRRRRAHGTEFTPESLSAESVSLTLDVVSSELLSPTKKVRRANEIQSLRSPRRLSALLTPKKDSPKALLSGIETPLLRRKLFDQKLKVGILLVTRTCHLNSNHGFMVLPNDGVYYTN